jgi:hypothetical protein
MIPEFQPGASEVDVCATASLFVQVIVAPGGMVTSGGAKARSPRNSAPARIVIVDLAPPGPGAGAGVGDGAGAGVEESVPHAAASMSASETPARRNDDI